jgi:hypothetical protein
MGYPFSPALLDPNILGEGIFYAENIDSDTILTIRPLHPSDERKFIVEAFGVDNAESDAPLYHFVTDVLLARSTYLWFATFRTSPDLSTDWAMNTFARVVVVAASLMRSLNDGRSTEFWASGYRTIAAEEAR